MIITLLAGIAAAILIAFAIIKYVPLKFRWLVSLALLSLASILAYAIYNSIMGPIRFNEEKKVRYAEVIEHLKMIRDAQEAHKRITGTFHNNKEGLVKFIDTAEFAITNTRNEVIEVNKGTKWQPIMVEIEQKVIDTTGYESVKEIIFKDRNYGVMFSVPGTDTTFELNAGYIQKIAGLKVPAFEAKIDKAILLKGLNKSLIKQEREAIGGDEVKGAYLAVGSLQEVNTNGNWPPFYDKKSE
jgi:hypothetical protein